MTVRNAELEDMKQLGHIMAVSFRSAFADFVSQQTMDACAQEDNCAAMLEGIYREGKMHFLIGENSGMLVWQKVQDSAEIVAIHSMPESWGTGLGHAMLEEVLNQIGNQPVFLWAFKENKRARRFQDTSREDESLYDAVQALLIRYNHMAGFISLMCLVCIALAEGIVLYGSNTLLPVWLHRFWINETLLLCFCTFDLILYFVISVLDPHKINRISNQKKTTLSGDTAQGDPEEFMAVWGQIEDNLLSLREELIKKMRFIPGANRNKPQIVQTLEVLRNYGRINMNLWRKLDKLRQYHNLSLHDLNMAVTQEMCDLAKDVLSELEKKVNS